MKRKQTEPEPLKKPTAKEIDKARWRVYREEQAVGLAPAEMEDAWKGEGWHKGEIYFGILIGLRIAENRARREVPVGARESEGE